MKQEEAKAEEHGLERRRAARHQYVREIEVRKKDGIGYSTVSFEISQVGISLATTRELQLGEQLELYPIVGRWVTAVVRRKAGAMYGLEFLGMTEGEKERIGELCKGLPLFRSLAAI